MGWKDSALQTHPLYELIFVHQFETVYCPIPKAACTSWKEYCRRITGLPEASSNRHVHDKRINGLCYASAVKREDLIRYLFVKHGGYFKFTVCRNPYSRLASAYHDLIAPVDTYTGRNVTAPSRLKMAYAERRNLRRSDVDNFTFPMFIEALSEERPILMDRHWQPQTLVACLSFMRYDATLKFEEMENKAEAITRRIGSDIPMQLHLNRKKVEREPVRSMFGPKEIETVRRVFANDFVRFRYDPDVIPED